MTDAPCLSYLLPDETGYPLGVLTGRVIAASYAVHRELGYGFLEATYRRAMAIELSIQGVDAREEVPYCAMYKGQPAGTYRVDLLVRGQLIVEVKAGPSFDPTAEAQLLNYLRVSGLQVGLVLHFGRRVTVRRLVGPLAATAAATPSPTPTTTTTTTTTTEHR